MFPGSLIYPTRDLSLQQPLLLCSLGVEALFSEGSLWGPHQALFTTPDAAHFVHPLLQLVSSTASHPARTSHPSPAPALGRGTRHPCYPRPGKTPPPVEARPEWKLPSCRGLRSGGRSRRAQRYASHRFRDLHSETRGAAAQQSLPSRQLKRVSYRQRKKAAQAPTPGGTLTAPRARAPVPPTALGALRGASSQPASQHNHHPAIRRRPPQSGAPPSSPPAGTLPATAREPPGPTNGRSPSARRGEARRGEGRTHAPVLNGRHSSSATLVLPGAAARAGQAGPRRPAPFFRSEAPPPPAASRLLWRELEPPPPPVPASAGVPAGWRCRSAAVPAPLPSKASQPRPAPGHAGQGGQRWALADESPAPRAPSAGQKRGGDPRRGEAGPSERDRTGLGDQRGARALTGTAVAQGGIGRA